MNDDPWELFAEALTREATRVPALSSKALAARLTVATGSEVAAETVSNWRRGRSRPPLTLLGHIVKSLNDDRSRQDASAGFSLYGLLQEMGILDDDVEASQLFDRAYRLDKLNTKLEAANDAFASIGRRVGAAAIVRAILDSDQWAVAVWPAYEGPDPSCRMHVADRVDIRRIGGARNSENDYDDVWSDLTIKNVLRSTHAVRSPVGVRWTPQPTPGVSTWSISHVGSPRAPVVTAPWDGLRALCVLATTRGSWVNDVASLLGLGLGYGLTTTANLAMTMTGRTPGSTSDHDRLLSHEGLLRHLPRRRVWSHWGMPSESSEMFGDTGLPRGESAKFIYLDESDELLESAANGDADLEQRLRAGRDVYRSAIGHFPPEQILRLDAKDHPLGDRDSHWAEVFDHVLASLQWLTASESGVSIPRRELQDAHELANRIEPGFAPPVYQWLSSHGWPA